MRSDIAIRAEVPDDVRDIREVVRSAFDRDNEARLIDRLRTAGDLQISLVATADSRIVGHVACSPMRSPARSVGLAPLAVLPACQRRGIGRALVEAAISRARATDAQMVFVLGDETYYGQFGFDAATAAYYPSGFPAENFMAIGLSGWAPEPGRAIYAVAFDAL